MSKHPFVEKKIFILRWKIFGLSLQPTLGDSCLLRGLHNEMIHADINAGMASAHVHTISADVQSSNVVLLCHFLYNCLYFLARK